MRTAIFVICFCVVQISVKAWVGLIPPDAKAAIEHGGHCYDRNIGVLAKNEVKRIENQCATATCLDDRTISLTGCGVIGIPPPCRVVTGDLSKPFPQCCFKIECPEGMEAEEKRLTATLPY